MKRAVFLSRLSEQSEILFTRVYSSNYDANLPTSFNPSFIISVNMDEDDDNWSYSFPPSTEDLLGPKVNHTVNSEEVTVNDNSLLYPTRKSSDSLNSDDNVEVDSLSDIGSSAFVRRQKTEEHPSWANEAGTPQPSVHQNEYTGVESTLPEPSPNYSLLYLSSQIFGSEQSNGLQRIKSLSLALQPAFMLKLAPADPQTTRKDANLIISKENASNALALIGDSPTSPSNSPALRSDFKNSIKIWQQKTHNDDHVLNSDDQPSGSEAIESNSPKIIAYRKTTHVRKVSNTLKLEEQEEKFDPKLYVSEKYQDTCYHYATMKRNVDFHQLFKSLDLTDRLLDDFACALSREILLQGRIYITKNCVCFNSNLLGWVTSLVVPFSEITRIDKKSTAGLFPNGIIVETKTSKHNFASFLSRDATFDFMRAIWLGATGKDISDLDSHPTDTFDADLSNSSERRISNYIMSIDEGDNVDVKWNDEHFEDSEEEMLDMNRDSLEDDVTETRAFDDNSGLSSSRIKTMKPDSAYKNKGPDSHSPTTITRVFDGSSEEIDVISEVIEAPLGAVFEILFGVENPTFHKNILRDQGATDLSDYGNFELAESDPSKLERSYTYQRPLGYSIGPKSTKCCVKEVIEYQDVNDSIVLLSITDTPDVPSGGSFSVMTRFYLNWCENNSTQVKIAYHIKWIGRSWIKGMVEKLTLSAQISVSKMIMEKLKTEVENQIHFIDLPSTQHHLHQTRISPVKISPEFHEPEPEKIIEEFERPTSHINGYSISPLTCLVIAFFAFVVYSHFKVVAEITGFRDLLIAQQQILGKLLELKLVGDTEVEGKDIDTADVERIVHLFRLLKQAI